MQNCCNSLASISILRLQLSSIPTVNLAQKNCAIKMRPKVSSWLLLDQKWSTSLHPYLGTQLQGHCLPTRVRTWLSWSSLLGLSFCCHVNRMLVADASPPPWGAQPESAHVPKGMRHRSLLRLQLAGARDPMLLLPVWRRWTHSTIGHLDIQKGKSREVLGA